MKERSKKKSELSKRDKKASTYRRVVAGNVNGMSVAQSGEQMKAYQFKTVPGYEHTLIWVNAAASELREEHRFDRYPDSIDPGPGGTSLHFVTFFSRLGLLGLVLRRRGCTRRIVSGLFSRRRNAGKARSKNTPY